MSFHFRYAMATLPIVLLLAALANSEEAALPNIILCMTDDQGWGDVGYNGNELIETPVLDEMAATGLRFDRFYAGHPVCSPTRGSVMTGRHPNRFGCFRFGYTLRPEEVTIAEALQQAGYATGHFGKWHLGPVKSGTPVNPGASGFDLWLSHDNFFELNPPLSRNGEEPTIHHGEGSMVIVKEALKFIEQRHNANQPSLAVIWFGSPHTPHQAAAEDLNVYQDKGLSKKQQNYMGEITGIDRAMGTLRNGLRKMKLADNTLLWFCSDNGSDKQGSTGGLRGHKRLLYEGGIRVPGIIEWPARIKKPMSTSIPVVTSDIYPTIIDLVGIDINNQIKPLDGISIVPLIENRMQKRPTPIGFWIYPFLKEQENDSYLPEESLIGTWRKFSNFTHPTPLTDSFPGEAALIDGDFKLYKNQNSVALYDLSADAAEEDNLTAQHPQVVESMLKELNRWQASVEQSLSGYDYVDTRHSSAQLKQVYQANGIKIGEVTQKSAIIWTRLTSIPELNLAGTPWPSSKKKSSIQVIPKGNTLADMNGAVPGSKGRVKLTYWPSSAPSNEQQTDWVEVDTDADFTHQFRLAGLSPGVAYQLKVQSQSIEGHEGETIVGRFKTAPLAADSRGVSFAVVTGQDYPRRDDKANGHKIYPLMQDLNLDFFVHTGDIEYYDKPMPFAPNIALARFKMNRLFALPYQKRFQNVTPSYFIKDDHDTLKNDCWPGQTYGDLTWENGLAIFKEQFPVGETPYRTVRWGKDLQVWLVEGRDFRSSNKLPDGPKKTIWGEQQKQWFFKTVSDSDATFKILISPTPLVGPDRTGKGDNHANKAFETEGNQLRKFISQQDNMFVCCGDRHWQYVSVDPVTGVREFSCGPTSNNHASGWSNKNRSPMHQYLNVIGGYLSVKIEHADGQPVAIFTHFGTDGKLLNEDRQFAK